MNALRSSGNLGSPLLTSYNGVSLNESTHTEAINVRPIKDSSNRTTIANEYSFTFVTTFGSTATDNDVLFMRQALTEPGRPFKFDSRGFGNLFSVNSNSLAKGDVQWGPETTELSFSGFAPGVTRRLRWQFRVRLADCPNARFALSGRVLEYNSTITHRPTKEGLVRNITGHLIIPNNRGGYGGRQAIDSADEWRGLVVPPLLFGFDREFDNFTLSEDRSRLDFSVTDTEMGPNAWPKWCVRKPAASFTVASVGGKGLASFASTLSCTYQVSKDCPDRFWPLKHFLGALVADRWAASAANLQLDPNVDAKASAIVPIDFKMGEPDIFGEVTTHSFSITWLVTTSLSRLLGASGFARPAGVLPGQRGNWTEWAASLQNSVLNPYGFQQVRFRAIDDRITDLCDPAPGSAIKGAATGFNINELSTFNINKAMTNLVGILPPYTPDASWLSYEQRMYVEINGGLVPVTPLPTKLKPATTTNNTLRGGEMPKVVGAGFNALAGALGGALGARLVAAGMARVPAVGGAGAAAGAGLTGAGKLANESQRRVKDKCYVWLIGRGARVNFEIPVPELIIDGVRVEYQPRLDRGEGFTQWIGFNAGPAPVYHASWRLRWYLPDGLPKNLPTPDNSVLDDRASFSAAFFG